MTFAEAAPVVPARGRRVDLVRHALVALAVGLLVLVGACRGSSAKVDLGDPGWAPGTIPYAPSSWLVAALMYAAYACGAAAVVIGLRHPPARPVRWRWVLLLGALALLTGPIGTADHTNYAAYGRIESLGGDSYAIGPVTFHGGTDPVATAVEPPWEMTPNVYGPLGSMVLAACSLVGGANLRQNVWAWQVVVVAAWLGCRWAMLRLAGSPETRARVDTLFTLNPVVYGILVLGAHMDILSGLAALLVLLAMRRHPVLVGIFLGAAASMKITYGVVGLGVLWAWRVLPPAQRLRRLAWGLGGFFTVFLSTLWWGGPKVFGRMTEASTGIGDVTMWAPLDTTARIYLPPVVFKAVLLPLVVVAVVALAWMLAHIVRIRPVTDPQPAVHPSGDTPAMLRDAIVATFVLNTAYCLAAGYELPWYETITWALMPELAMAALELVITVRFTAMSMAFIPGRSRGVHPEVDVVTLFIRHSVMPLVCMGAYLAVAVMWRRRWHHLDSADRRLPWQRRAVVADR